MNIFDFTKHFPDENLVYYILKPKETKPVSFAQNVVANNITSLETNWVTNANTVIHGSHYVQER